MWMTPALVTAASIFCASFNVLASGFSQKTILPAFAASIAISAWLSPGVAMSTMSMSLRRTTSRQSVALSSQPELVGRRFRTLASVRPQSTFIRGRYFG